MRNHVRRNHSELEEEGSEGNDDVVAPLDTLSSKEGHATTKGIVVMWHQLIPRQRSGDIICSAGGAGDAPAVPTSLIPHHPQKTVQQEK